MEIIKDRLFADESVELDGKHFTRCTFTNCVLEYHGGDITFDRTAMKGCRHVFYGNARQVVHYLQNMGLMPFEPAEWGEFPSQIH